MFFANWKFAAFQVWILFVTGCLSFFSGAPEPFLGALIAFLIFSLPLMVGEWWHERGR